MYPFDFEHSYYGYIVVISCYLHYIYYNYIEKKTG